MSAAILEANRVLRGVLSSYEQQLADTGRRLAELPALFEETRQCAAAATDCFATESAMYPARRAAPQSLEA